MARSAVSPIRVSSPMEVAYNLPTELNVSTHKTSPQQATLNRQVLFSLLQLMLPRQLQSLALVLAQLALYLFFLSVESTQISPQ
jgi:hypothetical protein